MYTKVKVREGQRRETTEAYFLVRVQRIQQTRDGRNRGKKKKSQKQLAFVETKLDREVKAREGQRRETTVFLGGGYRDTRSKEE